jgi:hypothetical protein
MGVATPEAWLTIVREKLPVIGMELQKAPMRFESPMVIISWVASTRDVPAMALAIVMCSMMARSGMTRRAEELSLTILDRENSSS